jgi:transposase-like protein
LEEKMIQIKYSEEQREQALKELEACGDINLVSRKFNIPTHAIYRFRREKLKSPQASQAQEVKRLTKELKEAELENRILRELLKKTYQVMPIDLN